ncbi:MAG: alpha amylase C-terminal domain-containing protein, partial [Chitinophagales bacterium]
ILCYRRIAGSSDDHLIVVCNFAQQTHLERKIKVSADSAYFELLNTDDEKYGGSGLINTGNYMPEKRADASETDETPYEITIMVPPISLIILKPVNS